jgi:Putative peptidoglycan binding domain
MTRGYYQGRIDGSYGRRTAFAVGVFQFNSGLPPTGHLDLSTLNALGLSNENLASLQPAPRHDETWVPEMKFKHGKWKVKWKKHHGHGGDEYAGDNWEGNRDEQRPVPDEH